MTRTLFFAAAAALVLSACDSTGPEAEVDLTVQTAADIAADPATGRDPNTGQAIDTGRFTLYSLRTGEVVLGYDEENRADSASTLWDIGFRGTDIIVNGGASGPGVGLATVVPEPFEDVAVATDYTLRRDGDSTCESGPSLAVCTGSGNGWYTYVPFPGNQGGYIIPTPGRTLVVRTADGEGYAKLRFTSYYQGNPAPSTIDFATPGRYYTFDYVLNAEGATFVGDES